MPGWEVKGGRGICLVGGGFLHLSRFKMMEREDLGSAVVEMPNPGLVVVRYAPGAIISAALIRELIGVRRRMVGRTPHVVIGIFPENLEFDMSLLQSDHYASPEEMEGLMAMAVVAEGAVVHPIAKLYFAYFPTRFKSRVFSLEREGMAWIREQWALLPVQ